jgi:hypothetical protein
MQSVIWSNIELKMFSPLLGFIACFLLLLNRCVKGGRAHRGKDASHVLQVADSSKRFPGEIVPGHL